VLKLLASQAAISLENTDLYRKLAEREARIRRMIDADVIGIFVWNLDGRILEANDAFAPIRRRRCKQVSFQFVLPKAQGPSR
jgi:PAS domain-containing protein